jgi:hypothetical protein
MNFSPIDQGLLIFYTAVSVIGIFGALVYIASRQK